MAEADFTNLPRPNRQVLVGSHYDVETVDIIASHIADLLVFDKGVEGGVERSQLPEHKSDN